MQHHDFIISSDTNETSDAIAASQVQAARWLLQWTLQQLAFASGVSQSTLISLEREAVAPRVATLRTLRRALERAGIDFLLKDGGGGSVWLRSTPGIVVEVDGRSIDTG